MSKFVMTNDKQEVRIRMSIDIPYTISVSETKVKDFEKYGPKGASGPVVKTIKITPTKQMNTLIINLKEN